jgi:hypothetical protein
MPDYRLRPEISNTNASRPAQEARLLAQGEGSNLPIL